MPFVNLKTTAPIDPETKEALASEIAGICSECLGKGEAWVMCGFEGGVDLMFRGSGEDIAYLDVKAFGAMRDDATDAMTGKLCALMTQRLGVPADRTYVSYLSTTQWGWNGGNF